MMKALKRSIKLVEKVVIKKVVRIEMSKMAKILKIKGVATKM